MKKLLILGTVLLLTFGLAISQASAFSLGGYLGPIKIKMSNWEILTDPTNDGIPPDPGPYPYFNLGGDNIEDSYGIFDVTTIFSDDGNNDTLWAKSTAGETLQGVWYGVDFQSLTFSSPPPSLDVESVGGRFDVWLDPTPGDFNANLGTGGYIADADGIAHNDYTGITDGDATLFMSFLLVPGVNPFTDATQAGDFNGGVIPGAGQSTLYGHVIPDVGSHWAVFDSNGYTRNYKTAGPDGLFYTGDEVDAVSIADLFGITNYFANDGSTAPIQGDWDLISEDPIRTSAVPEPATMLLLGVGLLGLAGLGRKRFRKKG